jgi:DNA polymerase-1
VGTLYLIDGYAQFFRAYHAIRTPMSSPVTKEPTNLTFGFVGMLLKLLRGEGRHVAAAGRGADYLVVAIDKSGDTGTFRSELYPEYKVNRPPPPEDLGVQVDRCLALLGAAGVPVVGVEGFEADDVIATLVERVLADRPDVLVRIVSKDKDLKQLLREGRVEMYDIHTDTLITQATLKDEQGITPAQVVDVLALMGDSVDNVPGVEGVGEKTATMLVGQHGGLDAVMAAADSIKGKRGENLRAARELVKLSRELVTLRRDAPVELSLEDARRGGLRLDALVPILKELGFNRYQDEVRQLTGGGGPAAETGKRQGGAGGGGDFAGEFGLGGTPGRKSPARAGTGKGQPAASKSGPDEPGGGLFDAPLFAHDDGPAVDGAVAGASVLDTAMDAGGRVRASDGSVYRCVRTRAELEELAAELRGCERFAIDTETTGLSPLEDRLCGLSFSTRAGTGWYVPVRSPESSSHLDEATVLGVLGPILEASTPARCGHNLKFDLLVLRRAGVRLGGFFCARAGAARHADDLEQHTALDAGLARREPASAFDSMVASYLIDATRSSHSLDALALALLGHANISIKDLIGSGHLQRSFDSVPLGPATLYAAEDADVALRLQRVMSPELAALGQGELFARLEMPLVEVLAELEWNGVRVDRAELERQRARLEGEMRAVRLKIDDEAHAALGRTINPESPKQLAAALFNKPGDEPPGLGLKGLKRTATGFSTDIEVLETLSQDAGVSTPIPRLILEHRQLSKLVGTYLVALSDAISPRTGRVHASFNQTVAATGRLSSSDPNLQNIPIRTPIGRDVRRAFVAEQGWVLVSADYSQIELRLLAHLARDPGLIEAFRQGVDVHTAVAAQINHVEPAQVTKAQRDGAKMVNFGIVYGITPFGLARRLGCPTAQAEEIITGYKKRFAGITTFLRECVDQAQRHGYVATMLGRRRAIPEIQIANPSRRALAERTAINTVVQGSAADLIKLAMVDLHRELRADPSVRAILQVHDELVVEVVAERAQEVREIVVARMESAMALSVPLKADSNISESWFEG